MLENTPSAGIIIIDSPLAAGGRLRARRSIPVADTRSRATCLKPIAIHSCWCGTRQRLRSNARLAATSTIQRQRQASRRSPSMRARGSRGGRRNVSSVAPMRPPQTASATCRSGDPQATLSSEDSSSAVAASAAATPSQWRRRRMLAEPQRARSSAAHSGIVVAQDLRCARPAARFSARITANVPDHDVSAGPSRAISQPVGARQRQRDRGQSRRPQRGWANAPAMQQHPEKQRRQFGARPTLHPPARVKPPGPVSSGPASTGIAGANKSNHRQAFFQKGLTTNPKRARAPRPSKTGVSSVTGDFQARNPVRAPILRGPSPRPFPLLFSPPSRASLRLRRFNLTARCATS